MMMKKDETTPTVFAPTISLHPITTIEGHKLFV